MSRPMTLPKLLLAAASSLVLTACAVGPRYQPPVEPPVAVTPDSQALVAAGQALAQPAQWWSVFGDPELDRLIGQGLAANLDVRVATARVNQARALFRDQALDRLPRVTTSAAYTRAREQTPGAGPGRVDLEQAQLGFDTAWELDLFGRVGHQVAAARADAEAAQADLRGAQVSVAAEIARAYFELRGAEARRRVAEENAASQGDTLRLTRIRREVGPGDPVDVESASARLSATEAAIPALRAAEAQARNRLAVLLGVRPGTLTIASAQAGAAAAGPAPLPLGDVSAFLRRRPDVQAAERRLAAQTALTGAATADLFPRISITGFVGVLSGDAGTLFKGNSGAWSVTPAITWPGLDLGGARARLRAQEARGDEALVLYERTVLTAVEDLQNALTAYHERQTQVLALSAQVMASRRAADLAQIRYKEGRIDFLRVLDAERTRLEAEDALTQAQTNADIDVVAIYKALGG